MKFKMTADIEFEANGLDDASKKLWFHFMNLYSKGLDEELPEELQFIGTMEISKKEGDL